MRRFFVIWNRGYKTQCVVAESPEEALNISMEAAHIKRVCNYRKFEDVTDATIEKFPSAIDLLSLGVSGVVGQSDDAWEFDGKTFAL